VNHFRRPRKKKSLARKHGVAVSMMALGLSVASFGFLVPASSGTNTGSRVFTEGLNIKLDRNSPAFAALEDAWASNGSATADSAAALEDSKVASSPLVAGSESTRFLAARILRANQREQSLLAQERTSRVARANAVSEAASDALRRMMSRFQPAPQVAVTDVVGEAGAAAPTADQNHLTTYATKTISLTALHVSREELVGSLFLPIANSNGAVQAANEVDTLPSTVTVVSAASPGHPRVIRAPQIPSHPDLASAPSSGTQVGGLSAPVSPSLDAKKWKPAFDDLAPEHDGNTEHADANDSQTASFVAKKPEQKQDQKPAVDQPVGTVLHQVVIAGTLEFTDGLALANSQDRVVVYREVDGDPAEHGAVWLRQGTYEVFAEDNTGFLIGELRTPYGDVIGRGVVDISRIPVTSPSQRRLEKVALQIKPVLQGVSGRIVSAKADGTLSPVRGAEVLFRDLPFDTKTDRAGHFEETRFLEGSNAIVQVNRPGYWGTLTFAHAGNENQIEIFPNQDDQMMRHLVSLTRAGDVTTTPSAIIWGRITQGGKPVAGARAELLTTNEIVQPIYFNSAMAPDLSLKGTTANGLYAFFPVPQGAHAVQAVLSNGSMSEPIIFPAETRTVSRMDIETSATHEAKVKVFDAFRTDYPLPAELSSPGSEQAVVIDRNGMGALRYSEGRGLLIVDADAGPSYLKTRVTMSRDRRTVYLPMIQATWLEKQRGALKINPEPGTGTIVGFVQGSSPYKIALEDRSVLPSSRVIYFDNKGEATAQEFGEPGGGFIVFNVPEGFRTITVQPSGSMKLHASVALVDGKATSVISHWIR
jgi:hypothetical protein